MNTILTLMFPFHGAQSLHISTKSDTQDDDFKFDLDNKSPMKNNLILFGDNNIYRTSLLFQAALTSALSKRETVFICKEKFNSLPLFVHNMPRPDNDLLKLIKFKYFQNCEQIIDYFAKIHMEKTQPSMIIIDDLMNFIDISNLEQELDCIRQGMLICAHARSALDFINTKIHCSLLVSCRHSDKEWYFKMYFDSFAYLKKVLEKERHLEIDYMEKESNEEMKVKFIHNESMLCLDQFRLEQNCVSFLK